MQKTALQINNGTSSELSVVVHLTDWKIERYTSNQD